MHFNGPDARQVAMNKTGARGAKKRKRKKTRGHTWRGKPCFHASL